MPYLEGRNTEETSGWTKGKTPSRWPTSLSSTKQGRRSAAERSPGEGHGGGRPRSVVARQERRRQWGN